MDQNLWADQTVGGTRGYDAGKKVGGRKRHILVDTQGFLLKVKVHSANIMDRDGITLLLDSVGEQFPNLHHLWVNSGYNGKGKEGLGRNSAGLDGGTGAPSSEDHAHLGTKGCGD